MTVGNDNNRQPGYLYNTFFSIGHEASQKQWWLLLDDGWTVASTCYRRIDSKTEKIGLTAFKKITLHGIIDTNVEEYALDRSLSWEVLYCDKTLDHSGD